MYFINKKFGEVIIQSKYNKDFIEKFKRHIKIIEQVKSVVSTDDNLISALENNYEESERDKKII
jgi:hypothetical protein